MVFTSNAPTIRAAKYLCICQLCKNDYRSCQVFKECTQNVHRINKINLRSNYDDYDESRNKNADIRKKIYLMNLWNQAAYVQ